MTEDIEVRLKEIVARASESAFDLPKMATLCVCDIPWLISELRSARKDAERLDWAERERLLPRPRILRGSWVFGIDEEIEEPTLREALDKAMSSIPSSTQEEQRG